MSDTPAQTPLIDLLRSVPSDARAEYEHGRFDHSMIPYGRLCHEAAEEIERLRAEVARLEQSVYAADASVADLTVMLAAERQRAGLPDVLVQGARVLVADADFRMSHTLYEDALRDILAAVESVENR